MMTKKMQVSKRRKYPWDQVDPKIFSNKATLKAISDEYKIPYRQVTNRKYNLRDKVQRLKERGDEVSLTKLLKYLKVKDVSQIPMLENS